MDFESIIESKQSAVGMAKPFERTINALKDIPDINSPMAKLEYIYQVFNKLMITEIDEFWRTVPNLDPSKLEIDYENLNGIAIYIALKSNLPILIVDILFIENFVSEAIMSTNRAYQMTVLHSALLFIEETLPTYYESKEKINPLKEQHFTPHFNSQSESALHHNLSQQSYQRGVLLAAAGNKNKKSFCNAEEDKTEDEDSIVEELERVKS